MVIYSFWTSQGVNCNGSLSPKVTRTVEHTCFWEMCAMLLVPELVPFRADVGRLEGGGQDQVRPEEDHPCLGRFLRNEGKLVSLCAYTLKMPGHNLTACLHCFLLFPVSVTLAWPKLSRAQQTSHALCIPGLLLTAQGRSSHTFNLALTDSQGSPPGLGIHALKKCRSLEAS